MLGYLCSGVQYLFLHSALLAVSLGEMIHMLQLIFPLLLSALLLLSFATVKAACLQMKGTKKCTYFSEILLNKMYQLVSSQMILFCSTLFGSAMLNQAVGTLGLMAILRGAQTP